jgi:hypothetical protein
MFLSAILSGLNDQQLFTMVMDLEDSAAVPVPASNTPVTL